MDPVELIRRLAEEERRLSMEGRAEASLGLRKASIERDQIDLCKQRCMILISSKEPEVIHPYIRKMNALAACE